MAHGGVQQSQTNKCAQHMPALTDGVGRLVSGIIALFAFVLRLLRLKLAQGSKALV